jgi:hypothetical protein
MQQPPNPNLPPSPLSQQQPDNTQPQTYYPPQEPLIPPKKRMRRTDKTVLAVIGAVVSILILAIIIAKANTSAAPHVHTPNATATAKTVANNATVSAGLTAITSDQTQTAMTPTPVQTTPTPIPTVKPTQQPFDPTANIPKVPGLGSENGPELGSPLSVFVTTFGPTTDNIWGIGGNDVSLAVDTTGSKVTYIFISTDDKVTWSKDQTKMIAFCSEFMPLDVATNGSPKQSSEFYSQNYTSSIGDLYMLINHSGGPGTWSCDMEMGSN